MGFLFPQPGRRHSSKPSRRPHTGSTSRSNRSASSSSGPLSIAQLCDADPDTIYETDAQIEAAPPGEGTPDYEYAGASRRGPAAETGSDLAPVYESGMQYHGLLRSPPANRNAAAKLYALPNDEVEKNRDDMKHNMATSLMGEQLFHAPVHRRLAAGGQVFDLGTGTGIWAIELAQKYPRSTVRGVDLSPIQPPRVPGNVFFGVDDFEDDWPYAPGFFDFVHMRFALWAVDDRMALLSKMYHYTKPGGYVEFQEFIPVLECDDGTLPPAHAAPNALRDFIAYLQMGLQQSQQLAGEFLSDELPHELRYAGFEGVRTVVHKCPIGTWPKSQELRRCGMLLQGAILEGLKGWAYRPLGVTAGGLGWTPTQIEMFLIEVRKAVMDPLVHAYFPMQVTYAYKPM